jgi:CRP-like cAMP-binding protein
VPLPIHAASNRLLAALPAKERDRLLGETALVHLPIGSVLYEQGRRIPYAYFPVTSFISLLTTVDENSTLEVGMVGAEGMCGHTLPLGSDIASVKALTQGAGSALRIKTSSFRRLLDRSPVLRELIARYLDVLFRQFTQTAACTRFHVVEHRLARWLLMTHDRAASDSFEVTQEFLAYMLGVRRVGITAAASLLKKRHLIRYTRGKLTVLDRTGLEKAACTCYRSDVQVYEKGMQLRSYSRNAPTAE